MWLSLTWPILAGELLSFYRVVVFRHYLLDLMRVTPRDANYNGPGSRFCILRPELITAFCQVSPACTMTSLLSYFHLYSIFNLFCLLYLVRISKPFFWGGGGWCLLLFLGSDSWHFIFSNFMLVRRPLPPRLKLLRGQNPSVSWKGRYQRPLIVQV